MTKKKKKGDTQNLKSTEKDDLYLYVFLIVIITFISFLPALYNGFTNWDDDVYILDNWKIKQLSWENIAFIFTSTHNGGYEPLTELSFAIDYHLFKLNPSFYHLNNIILHIFNALLVFWLINLLIKRIDVALFTSILFSIHPMRVESVAWIAERKDVLFSFFYLLSFVSYIYYINKKNKKFLFFSIILFFLSLLPKGQALLFPFVLILVDFLFGRKINIKSLAEKLPYFFISAIFFVILYVGHKETRQIGVETTSSMLQNIMYANFGLVFYLIRFILPFGLSNCYPLPDRFWDGFFHYVYLISPVLVLVIVIIIFLNKKNKLLVFVSLFYFINLLLVLQLKRTGPAVVADRYTYIPYIALSLFAGNYIIPYYDKVKDNKNLRRVLFVLMILFFMVLSVLTWQRSKVWKDSLTLWSDTLRKYPKNPVAHNHIALYYHKTEKNYEKAIEHFKEAIKYDKKYFAAYNNLGTLYHDKGEYQNAIEYYLIGAELNPTSHQSYYNIGYAYHKLNKTTDAIIYYKKALELKKDYLSALNNLARALMEQKRYDEAEAYIQDALSYNPNYLLAYITYSDLFIEKGNIQRAESFLLQVLRIDTENALAKYKLALLYVKKGSNEKAIEILKWLVKRDIKQIEPYLELAKIYLALGEVDNFYLYIKEAEKIDPNDKRIEELKKGIKK